MSTDRKPHPFAEIFPMLPDEELQELAERIKKNGLNNPIMLYEEQILDGRNRYAACKIAGTIPKMTKFNGTRQQALDYVYDQNLPRRHMSASQRAMCAAKIADMPVGKPATEKHETQSETPAGSTGTTPTKNNKTSINAAAKKLKVSPASVKAAKAVLKKSPEKAKEVEAGTKTVAQAHKEMQQETGKKTDKDLAVMLGNTAIATLGRIKTEFRKDIYERVKIWIDANIDL